MGDVWALKGSGQILENVHPLQQCLVFWCTIHNPAPGPWDDWEMVFGYQGMLRVCEHGYRHSAVEDIINGASWGIHECDGCPCGLDAIRWDEVEGDGVA